MGWVIGILAIMLFLMAVRFMFAIPKIFSERISVREAIRFSLDKTRKRLIFYSWHLSWIVFKSLFIYTPSLSLVLSFFKNMWIISLMQLVLVSGFQFCSHEAGLLFHAELLLIKFLSFLTDKSLADYPRKRGILGYGL